MKNLKLWFGALAFVTATTVVAQPKPLIEKDGKQTKVTYFHEDKTIAKTGFLVNGKADGKWVEYDNSGNIVTVAFYKQGVKEGTWMIWQDNGTTLYELLYDNNKLVNADKWKIDKKNLLANN